MQTPQVSNPANLITSQPTPARQADAGSSEAPFGQVLSREIAGRNTQEPGRTQSRESEGHGHGRKAVRNEGKSADAKVSREPKQVRSSDHKADDSKVDDIDAATQASEDMLALVANLAQIGQAADHLNTQNEQASLLANGGDEGIAAGSEAAMLANLTQMSVAVDPSTASQSGIAAAPVIAHTSPSTTFAADQIASGTDLATVAFSGVGDQLQSAKAQDTRANSLQSDISDLAAKGRELLNGASLDGMAGRVRVQDQALAAPLIPNGSTALSSGPQDFSSAVEDSLSAFATTTNGVMPPLQQAAIQAAQAMGDNAAERLTPRVGTPAWDQALGQKVVWMVAGEQQSASLTLNPPDLGPLQVVLNVTNSQANATFTAAQPEVRQALESALPKLREMLGEAGIQLGQASVNSGSPNQQGAFEQPGSSSHGLGHADHRDNASGTESPRVTRVRPASVGQGMVDTFA